MSTLFLSIVFLLCSKFNIINSILLFLLLIVFIYLDMQGTITGMSLNVNFSEVIRYIQVSLLPLNILYIITGLGGGGAEKVVV